MATLARPIFRENIAQAVRAPKTAELVARRIRNAIIRGELSDGDSLPNEASLIAEFKVSRPTIREAIRILEAEGLVVVGRGSRGGAKVVQPGLEMVARASGIALQAQGVTIGDLYEMRSLIEPPATRLIAERNSVEAVRVLRAQIEVELALVDDRPRVMVAIADFHRLMLDLCTNKTLVVVSRSLAGLVEAHLSFVQRNERQTDPAAMHRRLNFGIRSHIRLVDLIEAKDGVGAEAHWKRHMAAAGRVWLERVGANTVVDLIED